MHLATHGLVPQKKGERCRRRLEDYLSGLILISLPRSSVFAGGGFAKNAGKTAKIGRRLELVILDLKNIPKIASKRVFWDVVLDLFFFFFEKKREFFFVFKGNKHDCSVLSKRSGGLKGIRSCM